MKRRNFIASTGLSALALGFTTSYTPGEVQTAKDLQDYLRSLYKVKEPSVDRIVIGKADTRIKKIGTAWMPYFSTLKKAIAEGVNVMVVHEPTFYTHWDLDKKVGDFYNSPSPAKDQYVEAVEEKRRWIEEHDLVIIRSHDVPDILKNIGIPYGFGHALGFTINDIISAKDYYIVYKITPSRADDVAKKISIKFRLDSEETPLSTHCWYMLLL